VFFSCSVGHSGSNFFLVGHSSFLLVPGTGSTLAFTTVVKGSLQWGLNILHVPVPPLYRVQRNVHDGTVTWYVLVLVLYQVRYQVPDWGASGRHSNSRTGTWYRYSYAYLTDQITHTSVLVELKLREVLSTASRPHRCPLSTTSTLYSFIAYRLTELDQIRGCDSREDLGIDDCSTHPSLPTADCRLPVRLTVRLMKVLICNLKSEIRFFFKVSNEPSHPVN